jgi:hypothetical protein
MDVGGVVLQVVLVPHSAGVYRRSPLSHERGKLDSSAAHDRLAEKQIKAECERARLIILSYCDIR